MNKPEYRPELAESARQALGYTQQQMADFFGITLNAWQKKEQGDTRVSVAEYHWLRLLENTHPDYLLIQCSKKPTLAGKTAESAFELGLHLSSPVVLPSRVRELFHALNLNLGAYLAEWEAEIEIAVGDLLPTKESQQLKDANEKLAAASAEIEKLKQLLASR